MPGTPVDNFYLEGTRFIIIPKTITKEAKSSVTLRMPDSSFILFCPRNQEELQHLVDLSKAIQKNNPRARLMVVVNSNLKLNLEIIPSYIACMNADFNALDRVQFFIDLNEHYTQDIHVLKRADQFEKMRKIKELAAFPPGLLPLIASYSEEREQVSMGPALARLGLHASSSSSSSSKEDNKKCILM